VPLVAAMAACICDAVSSVATTAAVVSKLTRRVFDLGVEGMAYLSEDDDGGWCPLAPGR